MKLFAILSFFIFMSVAIDAGTHDRIAHKLDKDGSFFYISRLKSMLNHSEEYLMHLANATLASKIEAEDKEMFAAQIESITLALSKLGLHNSVNIGASSIELPQQFNSRTLFRNTLFLDNPDNYPGMIWQGIDPENHDLKGLINNIPANAEFVLNLSLKTQLIISAIEDFRDTLNTPKLFNSLEYKNLSNSQNLNITIIRLPAISEDSKIYPWGLSLAIDDNNRFFYNLITSILGYPSVGNEIFMRPLPGLKNQENSPRIAYKNGKTYLYSSRECQDFLNNKFIPMAKEKNFNILMQNIPENGAGFLFVSPSFKTFIAYINRAFNLNQELKPTPALLAVMQRENNSIKLTINSDWDFNIATAQIPIQFVRDFLIKGIAQKNRENKKSAQAEQPFILAEKYLLDIAKKINDFRQKNGAMDKKSLLSSLESTDHKFIFWDAPNSKDDPNLPIITSAPTAFNDKFIILFNSGKVETFSLQKLNSAKRLIGFLQSRFKYNENDFTRLIQRAIKLDNQP